MSTAALSTSGPAAWRAEASRCASLDPKADTKLSTVHRLPATEGLAVEIHERTVTESGHTKAGGGVMNMTH